MFCVVSKILGVAHKVATFLKPYVPKIALFAGSTSVVAGTFLACKATLRVNDILDEHNADLDAIEKGAEHPEYTAEDQKHDRIVLYSATAGKFFKNYAPAVILIAFGIASILYGFGLVSKWHTFAVSSLAAIDTKFADYRKSVIKNYGPEVDKRLSGQYLEAKKEIIENKTIDISDEKSKDKDENGEVSEVKNTETVAYTIDFNDVVEDDFTYVFDYRNPKWNEVYTKDCVPNDTLQIVLGDVGRLCAGLDKLITKLNYGAINHFFMNEALETMQFDKNGIGHMFGWINSDLDPKLDFAMSPSHFCTVTPFVRSFDYDNVEESRIIPIDIRDEEMSEVFKINYISDETSVGYIVNFHVYSDENGIPRQIYRKVFG